MCDAAGNGERGSGLSERRMLLADDATRDRRRPSAKIVLIIAALVTLVAALVTSAVLDRRGSADLARAEAQARAAGVAPTYKDKYYDQWREVGRLTDNAAFYYEAAFSNLRYDGKIEESTKAPLVGESTQMAPEDARTPLPPEMLAETRKYLEARRNVVELIHMGSALPRCVYSVRWDGLMTLVPHLTYARRSARIIALQMWLYAEEGRSEDTAMLTEDGLILGKSLLAEPAGISGNVAIAIETLIVDQGLSRVLSRTSPSNEELARVEKALLQAAEDVSLRTAFAGEVAMVSDLYDRLLGGQVYTTTKEGRLVSATPARRAWLWFVRGDVKSNRAKAIRLVLEMVEKAGNRAPEALKADYRDGWKARLAGVKYVDCGLLAEGLAKLPVAGEKMRAKLRAAAACVAAMRFRNGTGSWPERLEELVPSYLDAVPLDPFTGNRLLYSVKDDGIIVYSVGENCVDDGGKPNLVQPAKDDRKVYDDVGFRVWK